MKIDLSQLAQLIYDKKGFNILVLDVRGFSSLTDYVMIAEGFVDIHLQSITKALIEKLEKMGVKSIDVEGKEAGDWIVIDCHEVTIHLFAPGLREKYQLERMWPESQIVELELEVKK